MQHDNNQKPSRLFHRLWAFLYLMCLATVGTLLSACYPPRMISDSFIEIQNPRGAVTKVRVGLVDPTLWQATLESLSFMPILEANPAAGVILTDWAGIPIQEKNNDDSDKRTRIPRQAEEEYMVNAHFLSQSLMPNALRLTIFRRIPAENGNWRLTAVQDELSSKLLDIIWSRVRERREATVSSPTP